MKIVHIVPALEKGGGEQVVVHLANWAAAAGHEITVVAGERVDETLLRANLNPAVAVDYVTQGRARFRRYFSALLWLWRRRRWLADQDIVHCHMTFSAAIGTAIYLARRVGGARRPAVVETYHAVGMPIPGLNRRVHRFMAKRRDALVLMAEDPFWRRFVEDHPRLQTRIIPNGIAIASRRIEAAEGLRYRRSLGIPDEATHVVGTIGRLNSERRPWLYPIAFAAAAARLGRHVHYVIAGDGPEADRVRAAIATERLEDRVHLAGFVRDPQLPLSIMDLYLTLNVGPLTGVAALEAAAAGLPLLAIQLVEGYQAGDEDWIWSSGDPVEVGERAAALLADDDARSELARRQSAYVAERHSVEVMAQAYQGLYEQLLGGPGRANATTDEG